MKLFTHISRVFLAVLFIVIIQFITYSATPIVVSIKVNGVTVIPGPSKTVQVCYGGQFNLNASNTSSTPPAGLQIPTEWRNLDSLRAYTGTQINTYDAGRWVATINYFSPSSGILTTASDTVHLVYGTTSSFQIITSKGSPITSSNIYICGLLDSTFLASPGYTNYKWYKNSTSDLVSSTNSLKITNDLLSAAEGTISFFVTATNSSGCDVYAQKNVRRDNSFIVDLGPDQNKCSGNTITLSSPSSPKGFLFGYKWNTGASGTSIIVNTTGLYWLSVTNGGTKCKLTDSVNITFSKAPIVNVTKDTTICNGTSVQLNAIVNNGVGTYTYAWTPTTGLSDPSIKNPIATPTTIGSTTYSVNVTDPLGCGGGASSSATKVTQLAPFSNLYFSLNPGNDTSICFNSTATLNPKIVSPTYAANYTWKWSPTTGLSSTTIQNPTLTLNTSGTYKYIITVTDDRGCKLMDSLNITNLFELTTTTNFIDTLSCVGTPINLIASATGGSSSGYTYNFTSTEGNIVGNTLTIALKDSTYKINVSATDSDGCESPKVTVKLVGYRPFIQIASKPDTLSYGGKPLKLIANIKNKPSTTVVWYDLPTTNVIEYGLTYTSTTEESIYAIATNNLYNCSNSDTVHITHRIEDLHALFIPNVFSPKATNPENQKLKVFGTLIKEDNFQFRIYNQWGQLVYQTTSFIEANSMGWSGDIKGNNGQQSNNVYTYTVEGNFFDDVPFNKTGTATMLQ
jgi:hypothetical protein